MIKIYKILALLLSYPNKDLMDSLNSLDSSIKDENILAGQDLEEIKSFISHLRSTNLLELQEEYVGLFDRGRAVSLHLFEHIHGESRDRGQAMVDLSAMYKENGLEISAAELPDFIPLFLEFLSTLESKKAADLLSEPIDILALIGARLEQRGSKYYIIFNLLQNLSTKKAKKIVLEESFDAKKTDEDINKQIDKEWEEPQVSFLGNASPESCGGCDQKPQSTLN